MSAMAIQHEHDLTMGNPSVDETQVLQTSPKEVSPDLLLAMSVPGPTTPLQNPPHVLHEISPAYPNKALHPSGMASSMHVSMPALSPPAYIPPMDVIETPTTAQPPSPNFIPEFTDPFVSNPHLDGGMIVQPTRSPHSSVSPPQSQVSSPAFSVGGMSSLASALDSTAMPSGEQTRTTTSLSPVSAPVQFTTTAALPSQHLVAGFPPPQDDNVIAAKQEESADTPSSLEVASYLAHTLAVGKEVLSACTDLKGHEAKARMRKFLDEVQLASKMLEMSLSRDENFLVPLRPSTIISTSSVSPTQEQHPSSFHTSLTVPSETAADAQVGLRVVDSTRKRCASAVEEGRIIKALKREPQEDMPLLNEGALVSPPSLVPQEPPPIFPPAMSISPTVQPPPAVSTTPPPILGAFTNQPSFSPPESIANHLQVGFTTFPSTVPPPSMEFTTTGPPLTTSVAPFPSPVRAWSDTATIPRHRHSLSASSINVNMIEHQAVPIGVAPPIPPAEPAPFPPLPAQANHASTVISPPVGRMSRSGSISGNYTVSFGFPYGERPELANTQSLWPEIARIAGPTSAPSMLPSWYTGTQEKSEPPLSTRSEGPASTHASPSDDDADDDEDDDPDDASPTRRHQHLLASDASATQTSSSSSDVPQEYRAEVDRIFFEYLNKICSNLDATDSKGEPIHQTLMAKKMQRLDESPDFRPFKFRIQAFTHAFLEELARQGYPEEKIPMKKIRNYLWKQQYILRFNEDGKKAKSKGNHIWNIEAKKAGDGKWEFRPFYRKLAGTPPPVAYCGLRWSWTPRVWDPQASFTNVPVQYSSPSLPSWLSWKDDILSGIPPPDAQSCDITISAKYTLDGQEGHLSTKFHLTIAPVSTIDTSFSHSRRSSGNTDVHTPRRSTSDSVLPQTVQRSSRVVPSLTPPNPEPPSQKAQVIKVLTTAAQRVAHERQSHLTSSYPPETAELNDLVKQQHVLTRLVKAYDKQLSGKVTEPHDDTQVLASAAHTVVIEAAHTVLADKASVTGVPPAVEQSNVTVNEVSAKTQDAVAQAVKLHGTASTEYDITLAATSILKEARVPVSPPGMLDALAALEPPRPHSTGSLPSRSFPSLAASNSSATTTTHFHPK